MTADGFVAQRHRLRQKLVGERIRFRELYDFRLASWTAAAGLGDRLSVASEFVAFEIGAAWALGKESVVPLVYWSRSKVNVPSLLTRFLYRDISRESELVRLGEDLASEIFVRADRPSASQLHAAARDFVECVNTRPATSRRRRDAG